MLPYSKNPPDPKFSISVFFFQNPEVKLWGQLYIRVSLLLAGPFIALDEMFREA